MLSDPPNILRAAIPPEGAVCAGCGRAFARRQKAVTRDGVNFYHPASDGGCEAKAKELKEKKEVL